MPHPTDAPARHGEDWTLLYVRRPGGNQAIAQVPLRPQTDFLRLRRTVLPAVLDALDKRSAPWTVSFIDETPDLLADEVYTHLDASRRYASAAAAWVGVRMARGGGVRDLRLLHPLTLETLCQCLMADDVEVDVSALDPDELLEAVGALVDEGERATTLAGCRVRR